jgi:tRNA-modifying protein YgfZ
VADSYAAWLDREVVAVTGPQAAEYLQGQLSQDVASMAEGETSWSWLLAPTGKVDALLRVSRRGETDWLLDTDAGWGDVVAARLNRFKLRTKVEVEVLPWRVLGLRGPGAAEAAVQMAMGDHGSAVNRLADSALNRLADSALNRLADSALNRLADSALYTVVDTWPGVDGVDVLGLEPTVPDGWRTATPAEYEAGRIAAGIPRMGAELSDRTIPGETGLIPMTVSFTKGCYTGQELVARVDSRGGNVPRRLVGLTMAGPVAAGTDLISGESTAGVVTSAARSPSGGWVGLGYLKRGFDPPVRLAAGPGGPVVEARSLGGT